MKKLRSAPYNNNRRLDYLDFVVLDRLEGKTDGVVAMALLLWIANITAAIFLCFAAANWIIQLP